MPVEVSAICINLHQCYSSVYTLLGFMHLEFGAVWHWFDRGGRKRHKASLCGCCENKNATSLSDVISKHWPFSKIESNSTWYMHVHPVLTAVDTSTWHVGLGLCVLWITKSKWPVSNLVDCLDGWGSLYRTLLASTSVVIVVEVIKGRPDLL